MTSATLRQQDRSDAPAFRAFEPLPVIAGERRLHMRAYQYWRARADGRAMPTLADCGDLQGTSFAGRMMLIDLARGDVPARIRRVGLELAAQMTPPVSGYLSRRGGLMDELVARLPALAMQRTPIGFEAETPEGGEAGCCFRGVLLPLADDTGAIAHVLGVMSWREIATADPSAEIVAALTDLPSASPEAPVPPWSLAPAPLRALAVASTDERMATARTRVALASADRLRSREHLHAAVGAAHDATADLDDDERSAVLRGLFEGAADSAQMEAVIAHARLLAIGGQALARRLDAEPNGMNGFLARARVRVVSGGRTVRFHFRLAPLDPDLLAPAVLRDEGARALPGQRRAAG